MLDMSYFGASSPRRLYGTDAFDLNRGTPPERVYHSPVVK